MVKFVKGIYAFTKEEVEQLIEKYNRNEFIKMGRKQYVQLQIKKKNKEIDQGRFEELIFYYDTKKEIYETMGSCHYKFDKFCINSYATVDIPEIRKIIQKRRDMSITEII